MFAVKDKRSGKYLRAFSGSYNKARWTRRYRLMQSLGRDPTKEEVHNEMFCLDTPAGAKTYKNPGAVATSFYSQRYRKENGRLPLAEALPWLEIVEVTLSVK